MTMAVENIGHLMKQDTPARILAFVSAICIDLRIFVGALKLIQSSCLAWPLFWIGVLVYHLWISDLMTRSPKASDTYFVVYHFGGLGLSIYVSLIVGIVSTLLLWLAKRQRH